MSKLVNALAQCFAGVYYDFEGFTLRWVEIDIRDLVQPIDYLQTPWHFTRVNQKPVPLFALTAYDIDHVSNIPE